MTATLGSEVYPAWLDVDLMVKPWMQWSSLTDSSHDEVLNIIVNGVCARAAKLRGGPIAPTTYSWEDGLGKFDGSGGLNSGYIMLPRTPVIQVEQVIEYQGNVPVVLDEIVDPAGLQENVGVTDGYQVNYRTGRLTRVLGGIWNRPFYPGSNNVWVTWQAGYNPIPPDWIQAGIEWVSFVYRNLQETVTAGRSVTAGSEYDPGDETDIFYRGVPNRITSVFSTNARVGIR